MSTHTALFFNRRAQATFKVECALFPFPTTAHSSFVRVAGPHRPGTGLVSMGRPSISPPRFDRLTYAL